MAQKNSVIFAVALNTIKAALMVEVTLEDKPRRLLLDTGSSLSLIEPGVSASKIQATGTNPVGITGDELPLQGE
jgi:hypothetical protein